MQILSFFDYAIQEQGEKRTIKFLEEMKKNIPYEELEELLIKEGVYRPKVAEEKGRHYIQVKYY
ncbi:hypothetical protein [Nitrosophilus labii]|uniref:hypothetical protein n=1 Tax=Nitrosophilus labii TaxID=2706014 RepID=UPI0016569476|nr:hypothetical protein [Nitrosophilus labii]